MGIKPKTPHFLRNIDIFGGDGGIRTLDRALQPYNGLANRRLQPLGHVSGQADMPDTAVSRKRKIKGYATRVTRLPPCAPARFSGAIPPLPLAAPSVPRFQHRRIHLRPENSVLLLVTGASWNQGRAQSSPAHAHQYKGCSLDRHVSRSKAAQFDGKPGVALARRSSAAIKNIFYKQWLAMYARSCLRAIYATSSGNALRRGCLAGLARHDGGRAGCRKADRTRAVEGHFGHARQWRRPAATAETPLRHPRPGRRRRQDIRAGVRHHQFNLRRPGNPVDRPDAEMAPAVQGTARCRCGRELQLRQPAALSRHRHLTGADGGRTDQRRQKRTGRRARRRLPQ